MDNKLNELPKDPYLLLSFVNMKLRDYYSSLEALCEDLGVSRDDIEMPLSAAGFTYNPDLNRFF